MRIDPKLRQRGDHAIEVFLERPGDALLMVGWLKGQRGDNANGKFLHIYPPSSGSTSGSLRGG